MATKSRRRKRTNKWSRANIMNYVAGGILAVSMVLGSIFVFGAGTPSTSAPQPTAIVSPTPPPAIGQAPTPTVIVTPTP